MSAEQGHLDEKMPQPAKTPQASTPAGATGALRQAPAVQASDAAWWAASPDAMETAARPILIVLIAATLGVIVIFYVIKLAGTIKSPRLGAGTPAWRQENLETQQALKEAQLLISSVGPAAGGTPAWSAPRVGQPQNVSRPAQPVVTRPPSPPEVRR